MGFVDLKGASHAAKKLKSEGHGCVVCALAARKSRHAFADHSWRVGHGTDERAGRQPVVELLQTHTCGDADDHLPCQRPAHGIVVEDGSELVRLRT